MLKLSQSKHSQGLRDAPDEQQTILKTYHSVDLRAVRFATRMRERNAFVVNVNAGTAVQLRVEDSDQLDEWLGALRHNMSFLRR